MFNFTFIQKKWNAVLNVPIKKKDGDENLCEDIRQWLENKIEQKKTTKELKKMWSDYGRGFMSDLLRSEFFVM